MRTPLFSLLWPLVGSLFVLSLASCDGGDEKDKPGDIRAPDLSEQDSPDDATEDLPDADERPDVPDMDVPRPEPGDRVTLDLAPYQAAGDARGARTYMATAENPLFGGDVALGRAGDWVLENERVRFVVENDTRAISPCPYGGTIIDAGARPSTDAPWPEDSAGEICTMFNVGRTLKPDTFEVLADGSEGTAILAVTGHLELLDFLHIKAQAQRILGNNTLDLLPRDPDAELPLTITVYYILRPEDQGVRVLTAMRNDGDETQHVVLSHLMNSGGQVEFFNPLNEYGGFGYKSLGEDNLNSTPLPFLAFQGPESGMAYVPKPVEGIPGDLPLGGSYVSISGVSVSALGVPNILALFLTLPQNFPTAPGTIGMEPGESKVREHWQFAADHSPSTMINPVWATLGVETGEVRGQVSRGGEPLAGASVSAVDAEGRTMNQARTGEDGRYTLLVPPGSYTLRARKDRREVASEVLEVEASNTYEEAVSMPAPGRLLLRVRRPDGSPTPARLLVFCEGDCPEADSSQLSDVTFDRLAGGQNVAAVEYAGADGELNVPLAPGTYRIAVTRGMEWSIWPQDAQTTRGMLLEVTEGQDIEVQAEIAHVVDTTGAISGDFHVHSISSSDSPIAHRDRVLGFAANGVDVLVSTDHDFVADLNPTIEALGLTEEMTNLVGVEVTTSNYGHFNAFPIEKDPESRNGGAYDWAGGPGFGKSPEEIFTAMRERPGEQVVQINHASSSSGLGGWDADLVRGITYVDPATLRLPPSDPDPVTGDTGLWTETFTAMEVMNGFGLSSLWGRFRWWMQMIGRGFAPAATAVTDTHRLRNEENGSPRTYVFVSEATDSPSTLDPNEFALGVNELRAIGTNGPFFRVSAQNTAGDKISLGETLATRGEPVTIRVDFDLPEWIHVDRLDVFSNLTEEILTEPGEMDRTEIPATMSVPVHLEEASLEVAATGTLEHKHRVGFVEFPFTAEDDAYVILALRSTSPGSPTMFPVLYSENVRPFAYSNPFFLDADGGGYNNPPLAALAASPPPTRRQNKPSPPAVMSVDAIKAIVHEASCQHDEP